MPTISIQEAKRMGIPKKNLQTILIKKDVSLKDSKKWLKDHNFVNSNYRLTKNERRFLQNFPIEGANYYSKNITPNIIFVFQEYT